MIHNLRLTLYLNGFLIKLNNVKTKISNTHKYHMKYFLIFLISVLVTTASSQPSVVNKEVQCDKTDTMIDVLKGKDFQEVPIWFGKSEGNVPNFLLFVNPETKSWTIIQFNKEISCVLGSGENFTVISKPSYI